jgi:uncharacterized protein (UPF0261 family)
VRGVSAIDVEGKPFHDPAADQALFANLKATLRPGVDVQELDMDINDPRFAQAMAHKLDELIRTASKQTAQARS